MRSPSESSLLFFSSPTGRADDGPEQEVSDLLAAARKIDALDDTFATIVDGNRDVFMDVFGRQVQLIRSRSQALEDAHVTVYDKVLLHLTDNGNDLACPAAITWYCTEYLGVHLESDVDHNAQLVKETLAVQSAGSQGLERTFPYPSPYTDSAQESAPFVSRNPSNASTLVTANAPNDIMKQPNGHEDPKFAHLWTVYHQARTDYMAAANDRSSDALETAKFLRDTAENGIHFLEMKYPKHAALTELKDTYNIAKKVVLDLNGGKKRKFDHAKETVARDTDAGAMHRDRAPYAATRNRENCERRIRQTYRPRERDRDRDRRPRGRGPSGIPYGYTRPVDSYHPA